MKWLISMGERDYDSYKRFEKERIRENSMIHMVEKREKQESVREVNFRSLEIGMKESLEEDSGNGFTVVGNEGEGDLEGDVDELDARVKDKRKAKVLYPYAKETCDARGNLVLIETCLTRGSGLLRLELVVELKGVLNGNESEQSRDNIEVSDEVSH